MDDEQIHAAIANHAACSYAHTLTPNWHTSLGLSAAVTELAKAEAALKAREQND